MLLMIDNYDSFTYNLVQYFGELGVDVRTYRNDAISLEQIEEAGWTLLAHTYDLHHNEELNQGNIMTEYEEKFSAKGNPINKLIAAYTVIEERR